MSRDEVELEKIVKSRFHYDQLASPLVSYMSRNSPSSSLMLVSPCLQCATFLSSPTCSSLSCPPVSELSDVPCFQAHEWTPPSSSPPVSDSSFATCHVSELSNPLLPLPPLK